MSIPREPSLSSEGSLAETDYLLLLSRDLGYLDPEGAKKLRSEAEEIARMLHAFRQKVERGP